LERNMIVAILLSALVALALASSHSEAPGTAAAPFQDLADFYAFRSYESGKSDRIILMATAYGGQRPGLGPNYFTLSDSHMFEIHVSCNNNGKSQDDHVFQFYFGNQMGGAVGTQLNTFDETDQCSYNQRFNLPNENTGVELNIGGKNIAIPLKVIEPLSATHPFGANNLQNWREKFFVQYVNRNNVTTLLSGPGANADGSFNKPFDYVGQKTFGTPDQYEDYAKGQHVYELDNMPQCSEPLRVFVGARADPFGIDLGRIFDLVNLVPIPGFPGATADCASNNFQSNSNVGAIVLEIPISCLQCPRAAGEANILGLWSRVGTLEHAGSAHVFGTQTNRLGHPLINEVVIGLRDKKFFNTAVPEQDAGLFLNYVTNPTFPEIISILFKDTVNKELNLNLASIAPSNFPRSDLVTTFLTGIPGLNQPNNVGASEMLRLNLDIAPVARENQDHYGVLAGDNAGFPNGRRPGDDALDLSVQVLMGALCYVKKSDGTNAGYCVGGESAAPVGGVKFLDGAPVNAMQFPNTFPFLNVPHSGGILNNPNPGECNSSTTVMVNMVAVLIVALVGILMF